MTFLELINKVMVGLREPTILGLSSAYDRLIAQFVNEAKEEIEDMGPWYALRTSVAGTTAAGTQTIDLTASTNERSYVLADESGLHQVWITTADEETRLLPITQEAMEDLYNSDANPDQGKPVYVSWARSNDGITLRFWPLPDAVYTVKARCVVPQDELETMSTTLTIPAAPVWKLALAKAMDERGSDFAGQQSKADEKAQKAIYDAILRDFGADPLTFWAE